MDFNQTALFANDARITTRFALQGSETKLDEYSFECGKYSNKVKDIIKRPTITVKTPDITKNYDSSYWDHLLYEHRLGSIKPDDYLSRKEEENLMNIFSQIFLSAGKRPYAFAPIRTKPKRTYEGYAITISPEGEHIPYYIREIYRSGKKENISFKEKIAIFGKSSGLFKEIETINYRENDETSPFELHIKLSPKDNYKISCVGYGVSQSLPILIETLSRPNGTWYAIQQPEIHLHPKAQAASGDLFFDLSENENKVFLIETHSDFIIDRFRLNLRKNPEHKIKAQVLFFERTDQGNTVTPIEIGKNGEYSSNQPQSYREFFINEQFELLKT